MNLETQFLTRLAGEPAILVSVDAVRGSVPREVGAWMAVFVQGSIGSVGGGHLEWDALIRARDLLRKSTVQSPDRVRYPLGPSLGQCCGGEVYLRFECVQAADVPILASRLTGERVPVALFGGGHVGRALVSVMANLPLDVTWVDSRDEVFPDLIPSNVRPEHSDPVQAAVAGLKPQSRVLIMSFSHAEDLEIVAACLARQRLHRDLPYVGLIGSRSKWASFRQRLEARGFFPDELARVTCPIGVAGITDKRPEVIAVSVAAQILQVPRGT